MGQRHETPGSMPEVPRPVSRRSLHLIFSSNLRGNLEMDNFVTPKLGSTRVLEASGSRLPGQEAINGHHRDSGDGRMNRAEHEGT